MRSIASALAGAALVVFCGCSTSHVLVGKQRAPIDPSLVKLYLRPPLKYEEVALLSADSNGSFKFSGQGRMDAAIGRLKREAAKLGANGILLSGAGDRYAGSVGIGSGAATAYGTDNGATAFGAGTSFSAPVLIKAASGVAIYVPPE